LEEKMDEKIMFDDDYEEELVLSSEREEGRC
jgi:hypothetical protein